MCVLQTRGASVEEESLAVSNKISIESETVKAADSNKQEAQPVKPDAFLSNLSAKVYAKLFTPIEIYYGFFSDTSLHLLVAGTRCKL